jgi:hypothetical protein
VDGQCIADDPENHPLAKTTPIYKLCEPPPGSLERVYGLPLGGTNAQLAYYSNVGELGAGHPRPTAIQAAVIAVHGAARNADDYFCVTVAATLLQSAFPQGAVAVIAPRFLFPQDGAVSLVGGGTPARWNGSDANGVWR